MPTETELNEVVIELRNEIHADDVKAIRDLVVSDNVFTGDDLFILEEMAWESVYKDAYADFSFIVAEQVSVEGNSIVGFACYGPVRPNHKEFYLYWLAVAERLRGQGIGSALLGASEDGVAIRDGKRLYTDSVGKDESDPARQFYLGRGYEEDFRGHKHFEPQDGRCMLSKRISL